jgi:hypothetical protein
LSCTISAWGTATGPNGEEQAIRIQLKRERFDVNEAYALRSQVSGLFRQKYGQWPENLGHGHDGEDPELAGGAEAGVEAAEARTGEPSGG